MKSKEEILDECCSSVIAWSDNRKKCVLEAMELYAGQSRWISVETPKHGNTVLIKDIIGDKHLGYFDTDSLIWRVNGIGIMQADEISGWMELPD